MIFGCIETEPEDVNECDAVKMKILDYKTLAIGFDKTAMQIEEYKVLKVEMMQRIQKGEKNLRIKYFKNIPKVIKVPQSKKN
ncbi:hypothetical protein JTB14_003157 [Gonioctena quinquepunctata]|nr:hypothetical protein JTB14_003157 [Gonioctena quinquepunctata]